MAKAQKSEMGKEGDGSRAGLFETSKARGIGWRSWGTGDATCGSAAERERAVGEEAVGGRKGMTSGPGLSAGERGERRRWPAGLRPRKEGEAPGWALQAERM